MTRLPPVKPKKQPVTGSLIRLQWWRSRDSSGANPLTDALEAHPQFKREWSILKQTKSTEIAYFYELARRLQVGCHENKPFPQLTIHAFNLLKGTWADAGLWDVPCKGYESMEDAIYVASKPSAKTVASRRHHVPFGHGSWTVVIRDVLNDDGSALSDFALNLSKSDKAIMEAVTARKSELNLAPRSVDTFKKFLARIRRDHGIQPTANVNTRRHPAWKQVEALDEQFRCEQSKNLRQQRQALNDSERQAQYEARKDYAAFLELWRERDVTREVDILIQQNPQWPAAIFNDIEKRVRKTIVGTSTKWEIAVEDRIFRQ